MADAPRPKHFRPGEGTTYQLGRMSVTFKTTAGESWNAFEPAGSGAGHHRLPTYDETFVICEGHYDFRLDDNLLKLGPGDVVFVPRGTPHGFISTGSPSRTPDHHQFAWGHLRCHDRRSNDARYREPDTSRL
jgi:mannose-6-phosphate isomerase-like protein (cupin superfamily)